MRAPTHLRSLDEDPGQNHAIQIPGDPHWAYDRSSHGETAEVRILSKTIKGSPSVEENPPHENTLGCILRRIHTNKQQTLGGTTCLTLLV